MRLVEFFSSPTLWLWVLTLVLGIGLFWGLFWFIHYLFRQGLQAPLAEATAYSQTLGSKITKRLSYFFARYGYFPKDPLSRSFANALSFLKNVIGGRGYRYRLPFFLVLGASGSGKTSLVKSLKFSNLGGEEPWNDSQSPCQWHFFDQGVLLDVSGSLLLEEGSLRSEEQEWNLLVNLLLNYRPNRPLDGLVLTVSALDLLTREEEDLRIRAEAIYSKLWHLQKILGVKLPVFIMITHCDRVAGFSSFCAEIPKESRDDIFGWSNPYPLEMAYSSLWIDEAFQKVVEQIIRIQQEIFAYGKIYAERDGLLLFPKEFQSLRTPLSIYMNHLFKGSSLKEEFFLRGVFFSGDGDMNPLPEQKVFQNLEASFDQALGPAYASDLSLSKNSVQHAKSLYFTTALFRDKIFLEQGLVRFTRNKLLANNRLLRLSQISVFLMFGGGILGLINSYNTLMNARAVILPSLNRIGYAIQRSLSDENRLSVDHNFFQQQAQLILQLLTDVSSERLFSPFIPMSWMSPLDKSIRSVLTVAYEVVILRAISYKIRERLDRALIGIPSMDRISESSKNVTPVQAPSFLAIRKYVNEMMLLQDLILKYNNLAENGSLKDFGAIIESLFGQSLSSDFFRDTNGIYRKALIESHPQPIGFYSYTAGSTEQLEKLIKTFFQEALNPSNLTPQVDNLQKALEAFGRANSSYSVAKLRELIEVLSGTISLFTSPEALWLKRENFDLGPVFNDVVGKIGACNFFEPSTADTFLNDCNSYFQKFRGLLAGYRSPLIGPLFILGAQRGSLLSQSLLNLQGFLNLFLAESFMKTLEPRKIQKVVSSDTIMLWNYRSLYEATNLINDFEAFFAKKMSGIPENSKFVLRSICLKALTESLESKLGEAQQTIPLGSNDKIAAPEELYLPEIQNLRAIMPSLLSLIGRLRAAEVLEVYKNFEEALRNQCLALLQKIDEIFEADSPYEPQQEPIDHWRGRDQVFQAFGVENATQLAIQLNLQRQRMNYLAREFAEPLVKLLSKIYEEDSEKPSILDKWNEILAQLDLYQRRGASAIKDLENFIAVDLPQMNVENCPIVLASVMSNGIGYFEHKKEAIRSRFHRQCKSANVKASESAYIKLANLFNTTLAGRYPFVPKGFTNYPDASFEDVENFYRLFEEQGYYAMELLRLKVKKQPCLRNALIFLNQMEKLRLFFRLLLPQASQQEESPSLPFELTFRTNESKEKNANQIISWVVKMGGESYDFSNTKTKARWPYSTDIVVEMRWALGSPYRPIKVSEQPALDVGPLTATFKYTGCWAFLRMLELQKPFSSDFVDGKDPSPTTLRFDVPTSLKDPTYSAVSSDADLPGETPPVTRVFMSLNPSSAGLKSFNLPPFPVEAPSISPLEKAKVSGKTFQKPKKSLAPKPCAPALSCQPLPTVKKKSVRPRKKGQKK